MLQIRTFTFNPFAENTYLVYDPEGNAFVVDPGMSNPIEEKNFKDFISEQNLTVKKIINTHAHIDHILGINFVKSTYHVPFYLHQDDDAVLHHAMNSAMMFGVPLATVPQKDGGIDVARSIHLGAEELHVLFTPGHSPGSVSFYYPKGNWIIAGDVLFERSIGRTDLPGGNFEILKESIQRQLYTLPDDTIVYPGHGPATTIGMEKNENPFVRA